MGRWKERKVRKEKEREKGQRGRDLGEHTLARKARKQEWKKWVKKTWIWWKGKQGRRRRQRRRWRRQQWRRWRRQQWLLSVGNNSLFKWGSSDWWTSLEHSNMDPKRQFRLQTMKIKRFYFRCSATKIWKFHFITQLYSYHKRFISLILNAVH